MSDVPDDCRAAKVNPSPIAMRPTLAADPTLQSMKRRVALIVVFVPFIGTVVAFGLLPFTGFSKITLGLMLSMYFISCLGISVGYHRLFTHRSFKTTNAVKALLIVMGSMAGHGPVVPWTSDHRRHHEFSDQAGDTHSPHDCQGQRFSRIRGLWHAHIGWMFGGALSNPVRYAPDLLRDPLIIRMNKFYLIWMLLGIVIPAVLGGALSGRWMGALEGGLWGGLVRMFILHHATWSINSITHLYGTRPYITKDYSANNGWLALPTVGEAWHNCHHAFPASAKFGLTWWQFDLGYLMIVSLKRLGLAWDVNSPSEEAMAAKRSSS